MPTPKMKESLMFMAQKRAHASTGTDMFLWAVKKRETALAKSVNGTMRVRGTYPRQWWDITMGEGIVAAEWGESERLYLTGGWFCQRVRCRVSMEDETFTDFNVFYDFHCSW